MALVLRNDGSLLLNPHTGGLAFGVPILGATNGVYQNCCGGKCDCMCNTLPSSWTLEFYDCTEECTCLNGMTITVDRGTTITGGIENDCAGYVNGSPYICEAGTGHIKWVGCHMDNGASGIFTVSMRINSDQVFFGIPTSTWPGYYFPFGTYPNDPARDVHYQDCFTPGTITVDGYLLYFAFDFLHYGFTVDVTPHP
ncbi:hypothetical protein [Anatilimnocola floriformis]|uniref:hypothetical protein n=1 Tax=Anatilimnocola floriformis TaxID=2948575 RepID=UPI0020C2D3E3|nr:hypothetical protein [Anatilimnocola floriformis]